MHSWRIWQSVGVLAACALLALAACARTQTASALPPADPSEHTEARAASMPDERPGVTRSANLSWVHATAGYVPPSAIIGGWEPGRTLYVCRGWYGNGVHPGKIVGNNCNIGWGGREVLLNAYEVLVGNNERVRWVDASHGGVPARAVSGGWEPGRPNLYICRAAHEGLQPGKLVGNNCNIGYGGRELTFPFYQVLVEN